MPSWGRKETQMFDRVCSADGNPHFCLNMNLNINASHITYSFCWDGIYTQPVEVSRDGYGEPVTYTFLIGSLDTGLDEVDTWKDLAGDDPSADSLAVFKSACHRWTIKHLDNNIS